MGRLNNGQLLTECLVRVEPLPGLTATARTPPTRRRHELAGAGSTSPQWVACLEGQPETDVRAVCGPNGDRVHERARPRPGRAGPPRRVGRLGSALRRLGDEVGAESGAALLRGLRQTCSGFGRHVIVSRAPTALISLDLRLSRRWLGRFRYAPTGTGRARWSCATPDAPVT